MQPLDIMKNETRIRLTLSEMDYALMELHDATQVNDESAICVIKDKLQDIRIRLLILGYFKH